jgi:hypothetical protein
MPANINQVTTANTFQQWLVATQDLIGVANNLTNGVGGTFYANTDLVVGGDLSVTGNVVGNVTFTGTISGSGISDIEGRALAFAIALG